MEGIDIQFVAAFASLLEKERTGQVVPIVWIKC
jgi:hypothetical protein